MANDLNLPPVVPHALIDYIDQSSDKMNIAFKVGDDLVGNYRDRRTSEHNTQIVTLFSSLPLSRDFSLAALYMPEWCYQRSPYAVAHILANTLLIVEAPDLNEDLFRIVLPSGRVIVVNFSYADGRPHAEWCTLATDDARQPITHG